MVLRGIEIQRRDPVGFTLFSCTTNFNGIAELASRLGRICAGMAPRLQTIRGRRLIGGQADSLHISHHTSRRRASRLPRAELPHLQRRFICRTDSTASTLLSA